MSEGSEAFTPSLATIRQSGTPLASDATLRDYFAAKIMAALIVSGGVEAIAEATLVGRQDFDSPCPTYPDDVIDRRGAGNNTAELAYMFADDMLEARKS